MYIAWSALYEGFSDREYFNVLIPKVIDEMARQHGRRPLTVPALPAVVFGQNGRSIDSVALEICREKEAFHLFFVHADTGGRAQETEIHFKREAYIDKAVDLCGFHSDCCVLLSPRHETEAWVLADRSAVCRAFGLSHNPPGSSLPLDAAAAERLVDPKACLADFTRLVLGRRRDPHTVQTMPLIAQYQSIDTLRASISFRRFEESLRIALTNFGAI